MVNINNLIKRKCEECDELFDVYPDDHETTCPCCRETPIFYPHSSGLDAFLYTDIQYRGGSH